MLKYAWPAARSGTRRTFLKRRQITSCPLSFVCVAIFFNTISAYFSLSPVKKLPDINPQQQLLPVYTSSSSPSSSLFVYFLLYSLTLLKYLLNSGTFRKRNYTKKKKFATKNLPQNCRLLSHGFFHD